MKKQGELLREEGKTLFFDRDADKKTRNKGLELLCRAQRCGDPEAMFIIANLLIDRVMSCVGKDSDKHAVELMWVAAKKGFAPARAYINDYCEKRYKEKFAEMPYSGYKGPLIGADGKVISLSKKGIFTPVDALLSYENGKNILTLSANITFLYSDSEVRRPGNFENAVINGMMMWEGEYEVFGGQKLTVKINLTKEMRILDTIFVMPITSGCEKSINAFSNLSVSPTGRAYTKKILREKRSFFTSTGRWTTGSRKCIFMQSPDGKFDDAFGLMHTAKHEFGHVLGLGDLYESRSDLMGGVESGTYAELDCYEVSDRVYNLVMCDSKGPVSNNDIEMVILAYKENKMQIFQKMKIKDEISKALGAGN